MLKYALKLEDGKEVLGFALSDKDIEALQSGKAVVSTLESVGVGLWQIDEDGSRSFVQPRNCKVVLTVANSREQIGALLGVDLSSTPRVED